MRDLSAAHAEAFLEMMSAERGAAGNTLEAYRRDLDDAASVLKAAGTTLARAGAADIRTVISDLTARGFSPASQARRLSALRQFYKFLHAEGLRDDDPTGVVDSPRKSRALPKVLSIDDVSRLLSQAEADIADARDNQEARQRIRFRALLELLYATGMRVSELVGLPYRVLAEGGRFLIMCAARAPRNAWCRCPVRRAPPSTPGSPRYRRGRGKGRISVSRQFGSDGHLSRQVFARELKDVAAAPACRSRKSRRMCCGMPLPVICWPAARTSGRFRNCSATPIFPPRRYTPMCSMSGSSNLSTNTTHLQSARKIAIKRACDKPKKADQSVTRAANCA
jgi:integrase/recombinase XerD